MTKKGGMSRREMLSGRFLGSLLGAAVDRVGAALGRETAEDEPEASRPPGHAPNAPVMRYPQTEADVKQGAPSVSTEGENAMARRRRTIPIVRPPGAIDEPSFLQACTRCNDCAEVCPHNAIVSAPERFREAAGTPMIDPDVSPCHMCEDMPCIAACDDEALSSLVPVQMGVARITEMNCLAWQGSFCSVCVEQCPVEGAIKVDQGRPRIVEDRCTGCGVCRFVCPAPANAILHMPTFVRPAPPEAPTAPDVQELPDA